jgi:hypothetical protein
VVIDEREWRLHVVIRTMGLCIGALGIAAAVIAPLLGSSTARSSFAGAGLAAGTVAALVISLLFTRARIQAVQTPRGTDLVILYGPTGWPRQRFAASAIESVSCEDDIQPRQWGGWGYRGSLRLFRRAGLISRRGEGIVVKMRTGAVLAITLDDAAAFAHQFG